MQPDLYSQAFYVHSRGFYSHCFDSLLNKCFCPSGIQRGLAPFLLSQDPLQRFLLAWSFILTHLLALPEGSTRRKRLTATLSDPFALISHLLDKLALMLPLPENNTFAVSEKEEIGGKGLSLQGFLSQVGVPSVENEWETLAVKMYRSVLTVLPASARTWFADLKDRNLVGAIEEYTAVNESQALIMRELGLVEVRVQRFPLPFNLYLCCGSFFCINHLILMG